MSDLAASIIMYTLLSFVLGVLFFYVFVPYLRRVQTDGQPLREDGPAGHLQSKKGTPTMGGVGILATAVVPALFILHIDKYVLALLFVVLSNALIGFADDFAKLHKGSSRGMTARSKFVGQWAVALLTAMLVGRIVNYDIVLPFGYVIHSAVMYILFAAFVVVATSNAVNLTDGLDGLAIVPLIVALSCCIFIAASGDAHSSSSYTNMLGFLALFVGSGLAFLWHNTLPAKVFMGDVGSLSLGSLLACALLLLQKELLLPIIGFLFVAETVSVILQVASFKLRGKRVFLMAPVHHHFEQMGVAESTIVVRAWLLSVCFALCGLLFWHYAY